MICDVLLDGVLDAGIEGGLEVRSGRGEEGSEFISGAMTAVVWVR